MRLTRRSLVLLAVAAVMVLLNVFGGPEIAGEDTLPALPPVLPEEVAVLQISTPIEKLRIERESMEKGTPGFDRWRIVTPLQFPADSAQIRSILRTFGPGIPMEAFVDGGNHEDYGVDDQAGLLVELFKTDEDEPASSVVVGKPSAGPLVFVRIPGAEDVYRADLDGRARYARPASEWRDKLANDLDRAAVASLTLTRGAESLRFRRGASTGVDADGNPLPGPWQLDGAAFAVDSATVDAVIRTLARIRAGEVHNPDYVAGLDTPRAVATLTLKDGATHTVTLGSLEAEGAAFIRVTGRDEVFRVAAAVGRVMLQPPDAFQDRTILGFERADVAAMALTEGGLTVVLEQADDGTSWAITQPANMDADQRQAMFTANTLAALRADGIPADTRFAATGARLEVRFRDGRTVALELGQAERDSDNRPLVRVRATGREGVFQLRESTVTELRKAFGRG